MSRLIDITGNALQIIRVGIHHFRKVSSGNYGLPGFPYGVDRDTNREKSDSNTDKTDAQLQSVPLLSLCSPAKCGAVFLVNINNINYLIKIWIDFN